LFFFCSIEILCFKFHQGRSVMLSLKQLFISSKNQSSLRSISSQQKFNLISSSNRFCFISSSKTNNNQKNNQQEKQIQNNNNNNKNVFTNNKSISSSIIKNNNEFKSSILFNSLFTSQQQLRSIHFSKISFAGTKYHEFLGPLHKNTPKEFEQDPNQKTPTSFAVVHIGGHQYKVTEGDLIFTEKLEAPVSSEIVFNKVLLYGTTTQTRIGAPLLEGIDIHAVVEEQTLADKELVFKKKRRKHYRRLNGHRQPLTTLRIKKIVSNDENNNSTTTQAESNQQQTQSQ